MDFRFSAKICFPPPCGVVHTRRHDVRQVGTRTLRGYMPEAPTSVGIHVCPNDVVRHSHTDPDKAQDCFCAVPCPAAQHLMCVLWQRPTRGGFYFLCLLNREVKPLCLLTALFLGVRELSRRRGRRTSPLEPPSCAGFGTLCRTKAHFRLRRHLFPWTGARTSE